MMRVSTSSISSNVLFNVQQTSERFFRAQQTVSTGKRLDKPSDDPASLPDDLALRTSIDNLAQYQKNLDDARGFLDASDSALGNAVSVIRKARVMAVQGSSDSLSTGNWDTLVNQVDGLITALGTVANSNYGSRYLFGGQRTTQAPFVLQAGEYTYRGGSRATADADLKIDTGPQQPMTINKPGDEVFNDAFQALKDLKTNLQYGQPARVSENSLPQLDKVLDSLTAAQADFGAKSQQLQTTGERYSRMSTNFTSFLSNIEDADIPSAVVELNTAQTAYQAALTASARSFQQSLLDFLK